MNKIINPIKYLHIRGKRILFQNFARLIFIISSYIFQLFLPPIFINQEYEKDIVGKSSSNSYCNIFPKRPTVHPTLRNETIISRVRHRCV